MKRQTLVRVLSLIIGALAIGMSGWGLVIAYLDHNDGSPSTNYGMWVYPLIIIIIGLTAAVVLWLLADIDKRLIRLEELR